MTLQTLHVRRSIVETTLPFALGKIAELRAQGWTDVRVAAQPFTDDYADLLSYLQFGS